MAREYYVLIHNIRKELADLELQVNYLAQKTPAKGTERKIEVFVYKKLRSGKKEPVNGAVVSLISGPSIKLISKLLTETSTTGIATFNYLLPGEYTIEVKDKLGTWPTQEVKYNTMEGLSQLPIQVNGITLDVYLGDYSPAHNKPSYIQSIEVTGPNYNREISNPKSELAIFTGLNPGEYTITVVRSPMDKEGRVFYWRYPSIEESFTIVTEEQKDILFYFVIPAFLIVELRYEDGEPATIYGAASVTLEKIKSFSQKDEGYEEKVKGAFKQDKELEFKTGKFWDTNLGKVWTSDNYINTGKLGKHWPQKLGMPRANWSSFMSDNWGSNWKTRILKETLDEGHYTRVVGQGDPPRLGDAVFLELLPGKYKLTVPTREFRYWRFSEEVREIEIELKWGSFKEVIILYDKWGKFIKSEFK